MTGNELDPELGELLGISRLTAESHGERVLWKLGVAGRVDAARCVIARLLELS